MSAAKAPPQPPLQRAERPGENPEGASPKGPLPFVMLHGVKRPFRARSEAHPEARHAAKPVQVPHAHLD